MRAAVRVSTCQVAAWMVLGAEALAQCGVETLKFFAGMPGDGDKFGGRVGIDGDLAIVDGHSRAHIFRFDGVTWREEAVLTGVDGLSDAVAVSGTSAVVANASADDLGFNAGAAYVYRFNGASWALEATLYGADTDFGDNFGSAVDVCGDVVVIGAPRRQVDAFGSAGAAYIFRRTAQGEWVQEAKLTAIDPGPGHLFGRSVAVSDGNVIIGSENDVPTVNAGAAYAYHFDGQAWVFEARMQSDQPAFQEFFGFSVDIHGDVAVVGRPDSFGGGDAYIFRRKPNGTWKPREAVLVPPVTSGCTGESVAVHGDLVLVGDSRGFDGMIMSGLVHVFRQESASWTHVDTLHPSPKAEDAFGEGVALQGTTACVGANLDDTGGPNAGAAYLFDLSACRPSRPADCNADGSVNIFDFLCFQGLVTTGDPAADCNADAVINIFDFLCFQGAVTEGCP
jgi:hypothetical protein